MELSIEYLSIFIFLLVCVLLAIILLLVSFIVSPKVLDSEKVSSYECGFEPFNNARSTFDVHFYVVGVLFLIFDLEIAYILPWAVSLQNVGDFGFECMFFFLALLTLGFAYEWCSGALDWSSGQKVAV